MKIVVMRYIQLWFCNFISVTMATIILSCLGCTWHQPRQQAMPWHSSDAQAVVVMPAQDALGATQKALASSPLSLPVDSVKDGVIITGWKEYPGDVHIVRRWYERTRFRITVTRDFLHPETDSRISVEDQTMERATDVQPWYNAPNTSRPQRSAEVLKQIIAQLRPARSS